MRLLIALTALALAACASNPHANNPDYQQCEYEAYKATPPGSSAMADAFHIHDLIKMCMRSKGYR